MGWRKSMASEETTTRETIFLCRLNRLLRSTRRSQPLRTPETLLGVFLAAFLVVQCSESQAPVPDDRYKKFTFEYVKINDHEIFSTSYDQDWFNSQPLEKCSVNVEFTPARVHYDDVDELPFNDRIYLENWVKNRWEPEPTEGDPQAPKYSNHVFSINWFLDVGGNKMTNVFGGEGEIISDCIFVCTGLGTNQCGWAYGRSIAASTLLHEFGHYMAELTHFCEHLENHTTNLTSVGCVMSTIHCDGATDWERICSWESGCSTKECGCRWTLDGSGRNSFCNKCADNFKLLYRPI